MNKLELFHKTACPYSAKVRDFIEQNQLASKIAYRDLEEDPEAETELTRLTGDIQVPCLVIDGMPMLESDDIIAWLQANLEPGQGDRDLPRAG